MKECMINLLNYLNGHYHFSFKHINIGIILMMLFGKNFNFQQINGIQLLSALENNVQELVMLIQEYSLIVDVRIINKVYAMAVQM